MLCLTIHAKWFGRLPKAKFLKLFALLYDYSQRNIRIYSAAPYAIKPSRWWKNCTATCIFEMQQNISLSFHILQNQEPKSILSINFMMDTLPLATRGPDYDHHSGHTMSISWLSANSLASAATIMTSWNSHWGHWWRGLQPMSSIITDAKSVDSNLVDVDRKTCPEQPGIWHNNSS